MKQMRDSKSDVPDCLARFVTEENPVMDVLDFNTVESDRWQLLSEQAVSETGPVVPEIDRGNRASGALDQAPASPAARALVSEIGRRIEEDRTSSETQKRVSALVAEGRQAYRRGKYTTAAARFREALELDPQSELAMDYLELAEDRSRQARRRRSASAPARASERELELPALGVPAAKPKPGNARITLYYKCPINAGVVTVVADGVTIAEIPFDHTQKGFLGLKTEGKGTIKRVFLTSSGTRTMAVTLSDRKRGVIGSKTFRETLPAGSEWSLKIDQPRASSEASFYLIRTSR